MLTPVLIITAALTQLPSGPESRPPAPLVAALLPRVPAGNDGPRWSPKGAKVALRRSESSLEGEFTLGPTGSKPTRVRLDRTDGAAHVDTLRIDLDGDGSYSDKERLTATPKDQRGKWWSSFETQLQIPVVDTRTDSAPTTRAYPLSLWYVEDPAEPDAPPVLRWSRRGWHEGEVSIGGKPALVMITELEMDGVFDQRDSWALARERAALMAAGARSLEQHLWLDGVAFRAVRIDANGRSLTFESFDPGFTEAEDRARGDIYRADREAPRAAKPVAFGDDLRVALATAKTSRKRVLVDFETTWCGPCKMMNQFVYGAASVVDAARDVVAVKVDGDAHRDLTRLHKVGAYPTIILLDADGAEIRRLVGYQGVAAMTAFLKP